MPPIPLAVGLAHGVRLEAIDVQPCVTRYAKALRVAVEARLATVRARAGLH